MLDETENNPAYLVDALFESDIFEGSIKYIQHASFIPVCFSTLARTPNFSWSYTAAH